MAEPAKPVQPVALEAGSGEWTPNEEDFVELRCIRPHCGRFLGKIAMRPGCEAVLKINCKTTECKVYDVFRVWNEGQGTEFSVRTEPKPMNIR